MFRRIFFTFFLIFLVSFLILPKFCLASDFKDITPEEIEKYLELPEKDAQNLLFTLKQVFTTDWIYRESSGYSTDEERLVPLVLRKAVMIQALNHLLIDAPIEVTGNIIKNAVKIARIFLVQDLGSVFEELEKESVKRAVNYGMNALFENEIRVTPGAIEFSYTSQRGEGEKAIFQYVLIYQPIDKQRGKVAIRFYSPNPIEPPRSQGSAGFTLGITSDLQHNLPPFIVEITGRVEKNEFNNYQWINEKGEISHPSVNITFPPTVPDLGIKPLSRWEKYVLKPIESTIKEVEIIITKVVGKSLGIVEIWNEIKSFISKITAFSPAGVVQVPEIKEEMFAEEEESEAVEVKPQQPPEEKQLTLAEIQERLDDLSEGIDVISQDAVELIGTKFKPKELELVEESVKEKKEKIIEEVKEEEVIEEKITEEGSKVGQEGGGQKLCEKVIGVQPLRNKIIINEAAWMGTNNSADDEWIELKNISGSSINLTGWQILDKDGQIKIVFALREAIPQGGFYLLERSDDNSVPNLKADLIYTGALKNSDEALELFDENCQLQDEVLTNPNWPAGDNSSKRTMERKPDLTWQTSAEPGGTPKKENSSGYYISSGGGSSYSTPSQSPPPSPSYPKILITEIQIESQTSEKEDFVELYNLNNEDVDLTNWYLQRKTKTGSDFSSYAPKNLFSGKIIKKQGYFVIANASSTFSADATTTYPLTADNTLYLKNPNGEIVDKVGWGVAQDYETATTSNPKAGESIGRKWSTTTESYIDTDNNFADFEIQEPTPKEKNKPKAEPTPESQPPFASFTFSPSTPFVDDEIIFDASSSTDSDGQITSFFWDFGDGNSTATTQATTTYFYSTSSQFLLKLTVEDEQKATGTATSTIEVKTQTLAQNVVISEIQIKAQEFVELYNPNEQQASTTGWYLCYFSKGREWNNPTLRKEFLATSTITTSSYFLIAFGDYPETEGNPNPDWKPYQAHLSDNTGAVGIFSCDPSASTTEAAINCKIDVFSWQEENSTSTFVFEGSPFLFEENDITEKSFQRKKNKDNFYIDNDDNLKDFELKNPLPENSKGEKADIFPPEKVSDFKIDEVNSKDKKVVLTWSTTTDQDTPEENLSYIIYYSKEELTEDNLEATSTFSATTSATIITISDLDYNSFYYFGIEAFDGWNYSSLSDVVSFQTPTFSTIAAGFPINLSVKNNGRKIVRASNGDLYVVYFREEAGMSKIFLAKSTDNGKSWQEIVVTPDATTTQKEPSIAIDSDDKLHLVWQGEDSSGIYQIRYRKFDGSSFSEIENLTNNENWEQAIPVIAVDSEGKVHIVWASLGGGIPRACWDVSYASHQIFYKTSADNWQSIERVGDDQDLSIISLAMVIDSQNNLHIVQQGVIWINCDSKPIVIRYQKRTESWSEITQFEGPFWDPSYQISLVVDSTDNLHLVWYDTGTCEPPYHYEFKSYLKYRKYDKSVNSWGEINLAVSNCRELISSPSISVDAQNYLYLVWQGWDQNKYQFGEDKIFQSKYETSWQNGSQLMTVEPTTLQKYPNLLWSFYPIISGVKTNQPKTGFAFIFYQGEELKFYGSGDLSWE